MIVTWLTPFKVFYQCTFWYSIYFIQNGDNSGCFFNDFLENGTRNFIIFWGFLVHVNWLTSLACWQVFAFLQGSFICSTNCEPCGEQVILEYHYWCLIAMKFSIFITGQAFFRSSWPRFKWWFRFSNICEHETNFEQKQFAKPLSLSINKV